MTELNASGPAEPMSDERLAEIRAREQGVPPAPWRSEDDARTLERWILSEDGTLEIGLGYVGNRTEDVAAFIVHARQDIPELLAEVERLRAMEQRVRKLRAEWKQGAVSAGRFRDQADQNRDVPNMLRENAWMTAYTEFGKEIDAALDGTEAGR